MEIHRPKGGLGSLSELAKEIGIIVIGVLIALAAEQLVETARWARRVADAEAMMRMELLRSGRDGYYRLAVRPCLEAKLDAIQRALTASRDTGAAVPLMADYTPPLRPWQGDAWDSARALQITGHMPAARLAAWSQAYFFVAATRVTQDDERHASEELNTLKVNAGRLEPTERDRLFRALVRTRHNLRLMDVGPTLAMQRSAVLGLRLSPADMEQQLRIARADYGDCTVAPKMPKELMGGGA